MRIGSRRHSNGKFGNVWRSTTSPTEGICMLVMPKGRYDIIINTKNELFSTDQVKWEPSQIAINPKLVNWGTRALFSFWETVSQANFSVRLLVSSENLLLSGCNSKSSVITSNVNSIRICFNPTFALGAPVKICFMAEDCCCWSTSRGGGGGCLNLLSRTWSIVSHVTFLSTMIVLADAISKF